MTAVETSNLFQQNIAMLTGLLLLLIILFLIIALVLEAIFRIRKEMIQLNVTANDIVHVLKQGYEELKPAQGQCNFKAAQWREDSREIVIKMLQEGKSYDEITIRLNVTKPYISRIERWAKKEGFLL